MDPWAGVAILALLLATFCFIIWLGTRKSE